MRAPRAQAGFTLVELMVSLVVFSFAMAGILAVAASLTQGYHDQRAAMEAQAAVRAPLDYLADAVRQASPGVPSGNILDAYDATTCAETPQALAVTDDVASGTPDVGTDVLDVIYASGGAVTSLAADWDGTTTTITVNDATQLAVGDSVVVSNVTEGALVHITNIAGSAGSYTLTLAAAACTGVQATYPAGSVVVRAQHARFFVETVSGIPTLMMNPTGDSTADSGALVQPLAEGIEDLQIALGVDTNGDTIVTDSGNTSDEWYGNATGDSALTGTIRAVRISIIARETLGLVGAPANKYYRPALEDHAAATSYDQYPRRILSSTVEIRNTGASP